MESVFECTLFLCLVARRWRSTLYPKAYIYKSVKIMFLSNTKTSNDCIPHILTTLYITHHSGSRILLYVIYVCQKHMLKASLNSNESLKLYLSFTGTYLRLYRSAIYGEKQPERYRCEENGDSIACCNKLLTTLFWFTVSCVYIRRSSTPYHLIINV